MAWIALAGDGLTAGGMFRHVLIRCAQMRAQWTDFGG